jgi:hypothetical protein
MLSPTLFEPNSLKLLNTHQQKKCINKYKILLFFIYVQRILPNGKKNFNDNKQRIKLTNKTLMAFSHFLS